MSSMISILTPMSLKTVGMTRLWRMYVENSCDNALPGEWRSAVLVHLVTVHFDTVFMAAGDQVPTDAAHARIAMLPELVDKFGRC